MDGKTLLEDIVRRIAGPKPLPRPYHAFTTQFDIEIDATRLDDAIGALTAEEKALLNQAWVEFETGLLPWKTRLHLAAAEASSRIREHSSGAEREDIVVSLLIDQSGSMRGQKMLYAAASADVVQEFLRGLKVRIEVLGFTTSKWRGGRSRISWVRRGKPFDPGRLNDLLHIIYRSADDVRSSAGGPEYRSMLRPDLLKENIDGEAILWAVERLRRRPEHRKILMIISDGAPVDDSTLQANTPTYLSDHLTHVIGLLQESGDIEVTAIGLGYDISCFYAKSRCVEGADQLAKAMIDEFEQSLVTPPQTRTDPGPSSSLEASSARVTPPL